MVKWSAVHDELLFAMSQKDSGLPADMFPDTTVSVREAFGIDQDFEVPAFSTRTEYVPAIDEAYRFDHDTTLAILAGFEVIWKTVLPINPFFSFPFTDVTTYSP